MENLQLWIFVAVSIASAGVNVGIYLQSHREYGRRISALNSRMDTLDEDKVDSRVHHEVVRRIDEHLARIEQSVWEITRRDRVRDEDRARDERLEREQRERAQREREERQRREKGGR